MNSIYFQLNNPVLNRKQHLSNFIQHSGLYKLSVKIYMIFNNIKNKSCEENQIAITIFVYLIQIYITVKIINLLKQYFQICGKMKKSRTDTSFGYILILFIILPVLPEFNNCT